VKHAASKMIRDSRYRISRPVEYTPSGSFPGSEGKTAEIPVCGSAAPEGQTRWVIIRPTCDKLIGVGRRASKEAPGQKVVDDRVVLKRPRKGASLREEVWQAEEGVVTRYNLAYINPRVCRKDNGRVLGYDNRHGEHHRHFMGEVEPIEFTSYERLADRFHREVVELWRSEDENDNQETKRSHGHGGSVL
jgi:hypothetical protein